MSACEKCWNDSRSMEAPDGLAYARLLFERSVAPCTPEDQAGPGAGQCPICQRMTLHQWTGEAMCKCPQL